MGIKKPMQNCLPSFAQGEDDETSVPIEPQQLLKTS